MEITLKFDCCCRKEVPRPAKPNVRKRQIEMATFGLTFTFEKATASDTNERELTITVDGADTPIVKSYDGNALESEELPFPVDTQLVAVLVDIDKAGNRSPASAAFSYKVTDTIPPPQPGAIGVKVRQLD